jgi:5-formyltetrahydrofolate cyclo-ligase
VRKAALARRKAEHAARGQAAAEALARHVPENILNQVYPVIASYMPLGSEIDPKPLLQRLLRPDTVLALPRIDGERFTFRAATPDTVFERDDTGAQTPPASADIVRPDLVLVPLIAFDALANRLGRGGGWYDRALSQFGHGENIPTLGLAFAVQYVDTVPAAPHDISLHGVVSDSGFFGGRRL